jgi:hypothetical protein
MTIPLPVLFALAAMAVLVWLGRRPHAASISTPAPIAPPGLSFHEPITPVAGQGLWILQAAPWVLLAYVFVSSSMAPSAPDQPPVPAPVVGLDLRGRFVGPDAATDAAISAALLGELADIVEWDGTQPTPRLSTGASIDDLRRTARELRTRGVSLGARQPAVRDEIKRFLDSQVGTDGGPIDATRRAAWVKAFRDVSIAAKEAAR